MEKPKRTKYIKLRLTSLEKKLIEKKAHHSGLATAVYCRDTALNKMIDYKLTAEELEVYQMLVKYHNNFQSISNLLKSKDSRFAQEVKATANEIKEHLKKFK